MQHRATRTILSAAILAALMAAGCGGRSTADQSAADAVTGTETANVDNCTLVTDEEASRLAGRELKHGEDGPLGCPYTPPGSLMGYFIVRVFDGKGPAKDNFGEHSADTVVHEIQGVGDSAAVLARDDDVNFIIVQKDGRYIQFVTTFIDDMTLGSPRVKQGLELALTAIGRIK